MKTLRTKTLPPLYTHGIGSLPRPQVVRDHLAQRNSLPTEDFSRRMDDFVAFAIRFRSKPVSTSSTTVNSGARRISVTYCAAADRNWSACLRKIGSYFRLDPALRRDPDPEHRGHK